MTAEKVSVTVNGREVCASVPPRYTLSDFIRDRAGLTGTNVGCGEGVCGSCTVLVDEVSARSCLLLARQADGSAVTTIEGLAGRAQLSAVQSALLRHRGFQCGFCTPGVVVLLEELLAEVDGGARPTPSEVRDRLAGVVCRCTGYQGILAAALECVAERAEKRAS